MIATKVKSLCVSNDALHSMPCVMLSRERPGKVWLVDIVALGMQSGQSVFITENPIKKFAIS